jgi:YesN/AraC family two-component response regulator
MSEQELSKLTILYVEDDVTTMTEVRQMLKRRHESVLVAENGANGLELFRRFRPDIVITDIMMPVMDGLRMARAIRDMDPEIPIIAATAHSDSSYLLEAIEIGIDHYVIKPIDLGKLLAAIEKCGRDIAARKALERHNEEREHLLAELKASLDGMKMLPGFLPICSHCKSIRNNEGDWEDVAAYITRLTNTKFSHSICPDCLKKYYPEHYEHIMAAIKKNGSM